MMNILSGCRFYQCFKLHIFILSSIIFRSMYSQNRLEPIDNAEKYSARTPQTADSEPTHHDNFHFKCLSFQDKFYRFQDASDVLSSQNHSIKAERNLNELQLIGKEKKHECYELVSNTTSNSEFMFGVKIVSGQNKGQKIMKTIEKIFENQQGLIMYIFGNQHEFCSIQEIKTYLEISLTTQEGFTRIILRQEITQKFKTEEGLVVIKDSEKNIEVNLLLEKRKNLIAKPICLKMHHEILGSILDEKFKLLNQSEILNEITSLTDLAGILFPLSKQNMGSRIIQKLLSKASQEEISRVFQELKPYFNELVENKYGNYVLQKIFTKSLPEQRMVLIRCIKHQAATLIKTKTGTFTFQCILKEIKQEELKELSEVFSNSFIEICLDEFGNHFARELISKEFNYQLYTQILSNYNLLAINKFGTVVLKAFLKIGVNYPHLRQQLLYKAQTYFNEIAVDEYGHYIIEQYFAYFQNAELIQILEHIKNYVVYFSQNPYSSSIIKKALQTYSDYVGIPLIDFLLRDGLQAMMESNSGCFILHRIMDFVHDSEWKTMFINQIKGSAASLNSYEKRIKWQKYFNLC